MGRNVLVFVVALSATPAFAQTLASSSPRFSVGAGIGGTLIPHRDSTVPGAAVRVAAGLTRRFSLEAVFDLPSRAECSNCDAFRILYGIQGHYALSARPRRVAGFLTFGGTGLLVERRRYREYQFSRADGTVVVVPARTTIRNSPPYVPTAGVAVHFAISRRVVLRGDAQMMLCNRFDGLGSRTSLSASFPLGR